MLKYGLASYALYGSYYTLFVIYGYTVLNNAGFDYSAYYPDYPSPYYWEVFMVFPLFMAEWLVLSLVVYGGGRLLRRKGTIKQILALLGVASIVPQLIAFAVVDTPNALLMPESIEDFARSGNYTDTASIYGPPGSPLRLIVDSYAYIAIIWALAVSCLAVARIEGVPYWKAMPFVFLGMIWILPVIILTKDCVILLW